MSKFDKATLAECVKVCREKANEADHAALLAEGIEEVEHVAASMMANHIADLLEAIETDE